MKILISNDDGVFAPGILYLAKALVTKHDVTIVAPDRERSAVSHGLTIHEPLFVKPVQIDDIAAWAVSGTPADCVKLGLDHFMQDSKPDLVVTGINNGPNTGINVFYSGTVSGALEATFLNVPAMAFSMGSFHPGHWETGAAVADVLVNSFEKRPFSGQMILNVNIPDRSLDCLKGYRYCLQSRLRYKDHYKRRQTPRGNDYFWLDGDHPDDSDDLNLDECALSNDWVAITPLQADFNAGTIKKEETIEWIKELGLPAKSCSLP